jgi:3-oxoacyl-[acyl-carrier-protein] synthase-3
MNKILAGIKGVQGYLPEDVLSNSDLEKMVDTNDEWIKSRTGISERRILKGESKGASYIGEQAVKGLLEKTGTDPLDIDLVICGTITGDMIFPDTANTISDKVGMKNAWGFDLNAACSGFLFSLNVGRQFIETGAYKKVIVLGLDVMSSIIDYTDRTTCVIFGDGGGAVLLEPVTDGTGIIDADLHADGSGRKFLHMKAGGSLKPPTLETVQNREHFVYQEGKAVFKSAIKGMVGSIEVIAKRQGLSYQDIDWLVPHQANMRIIQSVAEAMDFPLEKVMVNIERYGNTTAGTLPLCLWEWENQLKKGDNLILTAFGGGFTWGAIYLKWSL